ncbi:hypothetical protein MG293_011254 [Ovis ammon polii]|uniref:Uncharacterized protein n=1 Tax=Ovis ammon polii TaxID=230172 RepID=A0AAD4U643_OVIAM|nr:hypothetical protein MG293_011254 [Ovis ammon polii]
MRKGVTWMTGANQSIKSRRANPCLPSFNVIDVLISSQCPVLQLLWVACKAEEAQQGIQSVLYNVKCSRASLSTDRSLGLLESTDGAVSLAILITFDLGNIVILYREDTGQCIVLSLSTQHQEKETHVFLELVGKEWIQRAILEFFKMLLPFGRTGDITKKESNSLAGHLPPVAYVFGYSKRIHYTGSRSVVVTPVDLVREHTSYTPDNPLKIHMIVKDRAVSHYDNSDECEDEILCALAQGDVRKEDIRTLNSRCRSGLSDLCIPSKSTSG